MKMHKDAVSNIGQPAEPKPEVVDCAIVESLDIARHQGITPADFIQLLDSGMQISDFLAAMKLERNDFRLTRGDLGQCVKWIP
jgi:hypothetical protein